MTPERNAAQQLIEGCQNLVRSLAWKIHSKLPSHVDVDDLIGYGQVGLAEAARDFDPARGLQFSTFAYYRIRGAIYDGLSKMSWLSRTHYRRARYQQMANEFLQLEGEEGGDPTAAHMEDEVRWLKSVTGALAVVYLATQAGAEEDEEEAIEDRSATSPPHAAITRELTAKLHELIQALPAESAQLIRSVYFDGLTLEEAGRRLGVSKAWASRLHRRVLGQLARGLRRLGLGD